MERTAQIKSSSKCQTIVAERGSIRQHSDSIEVVPLQFPSRSKPKSLPDKRHSLERSSDSSRSQLCEISRNVRSVQPSIRC